ncbi:MAG: hypothetical protein B7733_15900 [Myxococcales bacterium FL481]|nr:MAG: hypothetical protein B7733_15900 [Myxococcales bacterium FL481]
MNDFDPRGLAGTSVGGRYKIVELLKRGAFSVSFRATDQQDGRAVYLRLFACPSDTPQDVERSLIGLFVRSAQAMTELSRNDNAVVGTRIGRGPHPLPDGRRVPWVVYEWIDGETLAERRRSRTDHEPPTASPLQTACERFRGIIDVLVRAHDRGIAHRRIDPAQIWIVPGPPETRRIDGFSGRPGAGENVKTPAGVPRDLPSPHYAAPEQKHRGGHNREGAWSDVYSLAVLLLDDMLGTRTTWEAWEQRSPDAADNADANSVPTPRALGLSVTDAQEEVFACALEPDPHRRFRSMREFREALEQSLSDGPVTWKQRAFAACTKAVGAFDYATPPPIPGTSPLGPPVTLQVPECEETTVARKAPSPPPHHRQSAAATVPESRLFPRPSNDDVASAQDPTPATPTTNPARPRLRRYAPWLLGGSLVVVAFAVIASEPAPKPGSAPTAAVRAAQAGPASPARANLTATAEPVAPTRSAPPALHCPPEMVAVDVSRPPANGAALSEYCLQRHEVTVSQYQACTLAGACSAPNPSSSWPQGSPDEQTANGELCNWRYSDRARHPINCVTWQQADAYCRFRGWRLPSNAEWGYAAAGPEQRPYPWGNAAPDRTTANACGLECRAWRHAHGLSASEVLYEADDGFPGTAPVGSFPRGATPTGIEDLAGNVFEWVADADPAGGDRRFIRGGGFGEFWAEALLTATGEQQDAGIHAHALGFRCAMNLH